MKAKELSKINYENSKKINEEYDSLVTNIIAYVKVDLTQEDGEDAVNDILEILLGAQERGENLYEVVGDYKEFCNEVIASYKEGNKFYFLRNFKENIEIAFWMLGFFIALDVLYKLEYVEKINIENLISLRYSLSPVPIIDTFIGAFIAGLILKTICKTDEINTVKERLRSKEFFRLWGVNIACIGLMVITRLLCRNVVIVKIANYFVVLVIAIIVFVIYICAGVKFIKR